MKEPRGKDDAGRRAEINSWVRQYTQELYRWAYHKTSDHQLSEDLVQETFLSAVESFQAFKRKSQPKTWLFGILKNKIAGHYRDTLRQHTMQPFDEIAAGHYFDATGRWEANGRPSPWDAQPQHLTNSASFNQVFQKCLSDLPTTMNSCIRLKYLDEKKGEQICQELGLTATNYWQLIHRAKLQLRACLEKHWFSLDLS